RETGRERHRVERGLQAGTRDVRAEFLQCGHQKLHADVPTLEELVVDVGTRRLLVHGVDVVGDGGLTGVRPLGWRVPGPDPHAVALTAAGLSERPGEQRLRTAEPDRRAGRATFAHPRQRRVRLEQETDEVTATTARVARVVAAV